MYKNGGKAVDLLLSLQLALDHMTGSGAAAGSASALEPLGDKEKEEEEETKDEKDG